MAKLVLVYFLAILGLALTRNIAATTYVVGGNSGWDISSDLDTWVQDKNFVVGDALIFQYSSSHSVDEVTKKDFDSCNTSNIVRTFTTGNTTVQLTQPGSRYFVCGNKLHCLGGMKLQVNVEDNQGNSPTSAPQAQPGSTLPNPSSKSNNPASVIPTSTGFIHGGRDSLATIFLGFLATLLWVVKI